MAYLFLLLAISAEVAATSIMLWAGGFTRLGPSLLIAAGYGAAFYFLSLTLGDIPAGVAYAVWSGVGIVLITAIAWIFGGQALDPAAVVGMTLIVAGVAVLNLFSKAAVR